MHVCSVTQSCLTLCNPRDCSPPGSSAQGILQAIMEWVAISFSNFAVEKSVLINMSKIYLGRVNYIWLRVYNCVFSS